MQQTDKWNLKLIELDDEIVDSLSAINENFNKIDENLGTGGGGGTSGGITEETDPTVPEYVKNIKESDIENWNSKQEKLTAGENVTIDENGVISVVGGGSTEPTEPYELPIASAETLGGIKVGNTLSVNEEGILNVIDSEKTLIFQNVTVETSLWVEDETYEQFGYKAEIACEGVAENYFSDVVFNVSEAISGNYAPISITSENKVIIYAVEKPTGTIIIPTIKCIEGA